MGSGRCAGLDTATFFPSDGMGVLKAVQICKTCPVRERCLEYALENAITMGVWGGVSERGRQRLRRSARHLGGAAPTTDPQQAQLASPTKDANGC